MDRRSRASDSDECGAGCPHCSPPAGEPQAGELAGGKMAALSAAFLLGPVVLAIAGSAVLAAVWQHEAGQLLGGLAGLAVGIVASSFAAGRLRGGGTKQKE